MLTARQMVLLAYSIGEWSTALDHIEASISTGFITPTPYATLGRVRNELRDLLNQWSAATARLIRNPEDDAVMIAEARAYCTQHQSALDDLTNLTPVREDN